MNRRSIFALPLLAIPTLAAPDLSYGERVAKFAQEKCKISLSPQQIDFLDGKRGIPKKQGQTTALAAAMHYELLLRPNLVIVVVSQGAKENPVYNYRENWPKGGIIHCRIPRKSMLQRAHDRFNVDLFVFDVNPGDYMFPVEPLPGIRFIGSYC